MIHSQSSVSDAGLLKKQVYDQVLEDARSLFDGQRNWISNFANAAALLWHAYHSLPSPLASVNWAGFYFADGNDREQLLLGPFQGKIACQTIALGRGVCGTAAQKGQTLIVDNVHDFAGHIACDEASQSEIVVPIVKEGKVVAIIDVDCAELQAFSDQDRRALEELAEILAVACDFSTQGSRLGME